MKTIYAALAVYGSCFAEGKGILLRLPCASVVYHQSRIDGNRTMIDSSYKAYPFYSFRIIQSI